MEIELLEGEGLMDSIFSGIGKLAGKAAGTLTKSVIPKVTQAAAHALPEIGKKVTSAVAEKAGAKAADYVDKLITGRKAAENIAKNTADRAMEKISNTFDPVVDEFVDAIQEDTPIPKKELMEHFESYIGKKNASRTEAPNAHNKLKRNKIKTIRATSRPYR